jgi:hypothetical protein
VKPALAERTDFNPTELDADQFARAQAGRITKVKQKAQALCSGD